MRSVSILLIILALPIGAQSETPEVARALMEEADRARASGRDDEAIEKYARVITSAPSMSSAYINLGALYFKQGKIEQAYQTFVAGVERVPAERTLLSNAAAAAQQLGKSAEALKYIDEALTKNRRDASLHSLRGTILRSLDRNEDALAAITEAVRLEPKEARYQFSAGNLLYQLGKKDEAIAAFRRSIDLDRGNLRAYYNLGAVLFESKMYDEALRAYMVALEPIEQAFRRGETVDVIHGRAYANLGAIYLTQKKWQEAIDAYQKALRLDAGNTTAHYNLGFIYFSTDQLERAETEYATALAADATLPLAYLHPGLIAARRDNHERAIDLLRRGAPHYDRESRVLALRALGRSHLALGARNEARAALEEALREGDDPETLMLLTEIARDAADLNTERMLLERSLKLEPTRSSLRAELASVLLRQNMPAEAKRQLDMIATPDPPTRMLRALLGLSGAPPPPAALSEAISALQPFATSDPTARGNLGLLLWQSGKSAEARPHLLAARAADPEWKAVTLALGELAFNAGQYEDAINLIDASRCRNGVEPPPSAARYITIGNQTALCARADQSLGIALLASAAEQTERAVRRQERIAEVRDVVERAERLPLSSDHQTIAWFLRGVLDLAAGNEMQARDELNRAVARGLPSTAERAARQNLAAIAQAERERALSALQPEPEPSTSEQRRTLVVYLPDAPAENEKDLAAAMTAFIEQFSSEANVPLRTQMFRRADDARSYVRANRDSVGILISPSELAMDLDLKPRFQFSRDGSRTHRRVVIVERGNAARSLSDLINASVSIPEGVNVGVSERSFGRVVPVTDDWGAIANVLFDKTEAAVVSETSPLLTQHLGKRLRVVHTTAPLPMPVIAFAPMPDDDRDALDGALRRASISAMNLDLTRLAVDPPPRRVVEGGREGGGRVEVVTVTPSSLTLRLASPAPNAVVRIATTRS